MKITGEWIDGVNDLQMKRCLSKTDKPDGFMETATFSVAKMSSKPKFKAYHTWDTKGIGEFDTRKEAQIAVENYIICNLKLFYRGSKFKMIKDEQQA